MNPKFFQKILEWNLLIQKEYEKIYKNKISSSERNSKKGFFVKREKKKFDKRIFLGGLKYLPVLIFCFLKNFPMPWDRGGKLKILLHNSQSLLIFSEKNLVASSFFLARWSISWLGKKKEDQKGKSFKRIVFPIIDDEESFAFYEEKMKNPLFQRNLNRKDPPGNFLEKEWLGTRRYFFNWFERNSKKKNIFVDFSLRISLLRLNFKGGLFGKFRSDFFSLKAQTFCKHSFFLTPFVEKKSSRLHLPLHQNLGGEELSARNLKTFSFFQPKNQPSYFLSSYFLKKKKFFKNLSFKKRSGKKANFLYLTRDFFLEKRKKYGSKGSFFLIFPFFFDTFFNQKKISSTLKVFQKESPFFQNPEKLLPAFMVPILNRILLEPYDLSKPKIALSYFFLLEKYFTKRKNVYKNGFPRKIGLLKVFEKSKFFLKTEITWIEGGVKICKDFHSMFLLLLGRKNLSFLNLDFNFNLKPTKTLTTKERKKSRFSNSFHLCREIIRFTKILVDCHFQKQMNFIDDFQLADGIHFILTHMGHLTGLYRYKYKVMKQIRICKSIKNLLYQKLNKFESKNRLGFTFWAPVWRIWIFFLRGMIPVLERWLSNLLIRHFNRRRHSSKTISLTKQRSEAYFDIEIKTVFLKEVNEFCSGISLVSSPKQLLIYANDAWRCWKANLNWKIPDLPEKILRIIFQFIKTKSDWWIKSTYLTRERIRRGLTVDKNLMKKNLGRLTRLWFKAEQKRQLDYLSSDPCLPRKETTGILDFFSKWLEISRSRVIPFPSFSDKNEIKLLILALENVYQNTLSTKNKFQNKFKNLEFIEKSFENPQKTLIQIKEVLLTKKIFDDIGINFLDNFSNLIPVFNIDFRENLTDCFLDQYIWFKANSQNFFPNWVKPSDFEIAPFLVFKNVSNIRNLFYEEFSLMDHNFFGAGIKIADSLEEINFSFLESFLSKILDPNLARFLCLGNNAGIFYKDMKHINIQGLIKGRVFSGFIIQTYFLLIDIIFLGMENSLLLSSSQYKGLDFRKKSPSFSKTKFYLRYLSNIISVESFPGKDFKTREIDKIKKKFKDLGSEILTTSENGFPKKFPEEIFKKKIPLLLGKLRIMTLFPEFVILSNTALQFRFELCGFEISSKLSFNLDRKIEKHLLKKKIKISDQSNFSQLTESAIQKFENRVKQLVLSSGSTTFTKIVNRWNSNILGTVSYFRETCIKTPKFLNLAGKNERKLQNRIKISLNSKMPSRFPPVLFFSPKELGGLGMLSISSQVVPENDIKFSKNYLGKKNSKTFEEDRENNSIPSLIFFFSSWKLEFNNSQKVWTEYLKRRIKRKIKGRSILVEDLEDLWNQGVPRINTLFQKDRNILAFDHGWRIRMELKKYQKLKNNPFWWTSLKHDGKLWDLSEYRVNIIQKNGGVENILEHTLFKGTYFPSWEGLFWEKNSGFEESFNLKKLTNAQRSGLNQIPNRRFTLWWSPTINRGNVYIGFQVQLDLTGIFMHGKIPTLKISLIQIFRAHLWQKIHESICISFCRVLDCQSSFLSIQLVQKEQIHPRKSYKMNSSCADIILFSKTEWRISTPSPMSFSEEKIFNFSKEKIDKFWIDFQLRWGDFDSHDIERYSRGKFLDYSVDPVSVYPHKKGVLIAFDLAYNIFGGYGFWIPGSKNLIRETSLKIIKVNPALYILRERIRKSLQLFVNEIPQTLVGFEDYNNIFKKKKVWLVDESCFYRVSVHRTPDGNLTAKPINGCLLIFLPNKGSLLLRVIHVSFWKQQKRLSQIARWKVAEEISSVISKLPKEEHPVELLTSRRSLVDPLGIYLSDLPNLQIKCTELRIFFQSLLKISKFKDLVKKAVISQSFIFNLYDDWLSTISPFTAFSRIILILKAIYINQEKVEKIFSLFSLTPLSFEFFWPKLSDKEWVKVENLLKDLVLEDYVFKKNCKLKDLTQNEIRDIILGAENKISNSDPNKEEKSPDENLDIRILTNNMKRTTFVSTLSKDFQKSFMTTSKWKKSLTFPKRNLTLLYNIKTQFISRKKNAFFYIVPRNLLKQLIKISWKGSDLVALFFGEKGFRNSIFWEIRVFLIPPQLTADGTIDFIKKIPDNKILQNFFFMGTIKVILNSTCFPKKRDLQVSREILKENKNIKIGNFFLLGLKKLKRNWEFAGLCLKIPSNQLFFEKVSKISLVISDRLVGFFLIPEHNSWDLSFNPALLSKKSSYKVEVSLPSSFFDLSINP